MAVENENAYSGPYAANGITTVFPFDFHAGGVDEVAVDIDGVPLDLSAFVVSLSDDGTGSVTIVPAPAEGEVYVRSDPNFRQEVEYQRFGPMYPDRLNPVLDRAAIRDIYLKSLVDRALKVPPGQVGPLVDLRGAEGKILQLFGGKIRGVPYYVPPGGSGTGAEYNVLDYGAKGHGTDHDDTPGFQAAMDAAWYAGGGTVVIPATPAGYNLAGPNIPFPSSPDSYVKRAVLKLRPNVSIRGVGMPLVRISGGRHNPPGMLFQAWWENDRIDNVDISGVWWDAACYSERLGPRNGNTYDGGSDVEESGIYQFQHAIAIWAGSNIRIHGNKFSSFRGSGVFPGNVGNLTPDAYLCDNVHVHNNEFVDMFRDAVFTAAVSSGSAYHNWCHGDGYWVAVFDIERTTANETLTGFKVYQNFIDGSDGLRPIELGRPGTTLVRACSLGFFYDGYPNDIADGKFRGHSFNENLVYHGVIDCWNPTDCSISDNVIINDVADIIPNGNLITSAAISLRYSSGGIGVRKIDVKGNKILHNIRCTAPFKTSYGIWCVGYRDINVSDNYVEGAELDGVRADYCTGVVERNRIVNCGTVDDRATGVVASASPDQIVIRDNIIEDQRGGDDRTIAHAVSLDGYFARWPVVTGNIGANVHGALIDGEALGFCHGNKDYTNSWTTNADVRIGGTLRAAGETTIGDSASDAAVVISAGGGDRAQLILSQSGAIEWILGQLGDGTLIEQNFALGMFERNVRIVYPDGTYQLALSWDQPLKANTNDYLWFEDGQLVVKSGSKATGPGQGTPLIGTGGGTSLDSVLASRALSSGDFPDRDDAIAVLPVGAYFTSGETGEPRTYRVTATSPYYEDQGDAAALVNRVAYDALAGRQDVVEQAIQFFTPEMFGAIGDASVSYDNDGIALAYAGTDDTIAVRAAIDAAIAVGGEVRLSRWYRLTSAIPYITNPIAIVGIGRFKCGFAYDAAASGACITFSECWMGKDKDEITVNMALRDPGQIYSGPRLEGFSVVGDRNTTNSQHGIVFHRRVDKIRMHDVGAYHIKGCGLWIGYDDRPAINGAGGAKANSRESHIQFESRWCGDSANGFAGIRYWSQGWQSGDDANNNNVLDFECFFADGDGVHISGRNFNKVFIRYDRWVRLFVEGATGDQVIVEGSVSNSRWHYMETNPITVGKSGLVLQEWSGFPASEALADVIPQLLTFTGAMGGRTGTLGIHAINLKNISFDNYTPSAYKDPAGSDLHLSVEATVGGVIQITGAASAGYQWNVSCANAALPFLRIDSGRMESSSAAVPRIKSASHHMIFVTDAFPGNTSGMAFSTGKSWVIWPVSTRLFKSDDTAVAASSAQYRLTDVQVSGTDTTSAQLKIGNAFDGAFWVQWTTPLVHGALPAMQINSDVANNGALGTAVALNLTTRGHLLPTQGIKLNVPQFTSDAEPSLLYREVIGDTNFMAYQYGTYSSRRGIGWRSGIPTADAPASGWTALNGSSILAIGDPLSWVSLTDGSWVPTGIVGGVQAAPQADSTATTIEGLVADFNSLLAKLRTANILKT